MKIVATVYAYKRDFAIIEDENGYWGIERKFIKNGKLTKKFNGITGLLNKNINDTINAILFRCCFEDLVNNGMETNDALLRATKTVFNI